MGKEIKVKVKGGYLIAGIDNGLDCDGIYIMFETDNGDMLDVVVASSVTENNESKIRVCCYEDVHNEDFTRQYTLNNREIYKAFEI